MGETITQPTILNEKTSSRHLLVFGNMGVKSQVFFGGSSLVAQIVSGIDHTCLSRTKLARDSFLLSFFIFSAFVDTAS